MNLNEIVKKAVNMGASDIHIVEGQKLKFRVHGELRDMSTAPLTHKTALDLVAQMTEGYKPFVGKELDFANSYEGVRARINVYQQMHGVSAALRILPNKIPELDSLGLPEAVKSFITMNQGIVLVTGRTGSGKSTTLAAILNEINKTRPVHIITLEEPIEYQYSPEQALINQREVGRDTETFNDGLVAALREDPDIVLIGEMRDTKTMEIAMTAAETGHLVFSTLHTMSAGDSVERIIEVFPADKQKQIRMQFASCLNAVISQQLLPARNGGRVLACELMIATPAIRTLIRESKTHMIDNAIQTSASEGNILMDNSLIRLRAEGKITKFQAIEYARDSEYVKKGLLG